MNDEINYKNNPLHGISIKNLLIEIVDHYGFEILFAYLNINCFKTNPSIASSVKFLKKTDWAREKVEAFYLYEFKNLPKATAEQFELPPRDRIIPDEQSPGEPAELSLEDAERLQEKRARKAAAHGKKPGHRSGASKSYGKAPRQEKSDSPYGNAPRKAAPVTPQASQPAQGDAEDPWANARKLAASKQRKSSE